MLGLAGHLAEILSSELVAMTGFMKLPRQQ
jgi:hypothetical protein